MNIIKRLFKSRGKPTDATSGSFYRFFFGVTAAGISLFVIA